MKAKTKCNTCGKSFVFFGEENRWSQEYQCDKCYVHTEKVNKWLDRWDVFKQTVQLVFCVGLALFCFNNSNIYIQFGGSAILIAELVVMVNKYGPGIL